MVRDQRTPANRNDRKGREKKEETVFVGQKPKTVCEWFYANLWNDLSLGEIQDISVCSNSTVSDVGAIPLCGPNFRFVECQQLMVGR